MSKIKSIHIKNFKFFGESEQIDLEGKNLLLYGENGSGKSSFSNAIYTLLEAASKQPVDIKKYFVYPSKETPEGLVNIHAEHDANGIANAFIEVLDDADRKYRLAYDDTALCGDLSFLESQRASEFINYKSLFSFQAFTHSQDLDLSRVFEYAVIPYLSCPKYPYVGKEIKTLSGLFDAYRDVDAIKQDNGKGKMVIYKYGKHGKKYYEDYCKLEKAINKRMEELKEGINSQLPRVLKELGYNFVAVLNYDEQTHIKHESWIEHKSYRITLSIKEYDGVGVELKRPHSFLNEAKLAALAFAIRWIIFERRPKKGVAPNALRVLVLDDLMISLDMGNRERMMNFLIKELESEVTEGYQLLFMTHERSLFNGFMLKLQQKYAMLEDKDRSMEKEWAILEMYDKEEGNIHFPLVQPFESAHARALTYFYGKNGFHIDYNSCGNALRQAIEEEFKRIFRLVDAKNQDNTNIDYEKLVVGDCLNIATYNFPLHQFSLQTVHRIQSHTKFTLNPTSHDSPDVNYYKEELLDAFEAVKELKSIQKISLVPAETEIFFNIKCSNDVVHSFHMIVHNDVKVNVDAAHDCGELCDAHMSVTIGEIGKKQFNRANTKFRKLYEETIEHIKNNTPDTPVEETINLMDILFINRQSLRDILKQKSKRIRAEQHISTSEMQNESDSNDEKAN